MALLEVERKFAILPSLLARFKSNQGAPPFVSLEYLGRKKIHDVYFDIRVFKSLDGSSTVKMEDVLAKNGIWVRSRNGIWGAKQRVPDDKTAAAPDAQHGHEKGGEESKYLRTIFNEIACPQDIQDLVRRYIPSSLSLSYPAVLDCTNNFGLERVADFTTTRDTYLADDRFRIMLDEMCFGHRVGEVEIEVPAEQGAEAQLEIDRFMERYRWFFLASEGGDGKGAKVKGKLTAYFEKFPAKL
ncbi:hypothetical protein VTN02DRAFT_2469 [Thermoascus thermophilus]